MAQAKIGYAAMLEQFGPAEILDLCARADAAGFSGVMAADHFQPWIAAAGPGLVRVGGAGGRRRAHAGATSVRA